jgi:hypothetical protein
MQNDGMVYNSEGARRGAKNAQARAPQVNYLQVPFRMPKSAAVLCIAIAVFATILAAVDAMAPALVLLAAWQVAPPPAGIVIRREDAPAEEQTSALLSLTLSRPPPCAAAA